MKYLSLPTLLILLCLNLYADEGIDRAHQESSDALQLVTKHQVLDEIERLKSEIDQLTSVGSISSSTALFASAVLATVVYGVTFTGLGFLFTKSEDESGVNSIIDALLVAIFPGVGLGALLSVKNSEPYVQPREAFGLSFKTAITSTGLWMLGYGIPSLLRRLIDGIFLELRFNDVQLSGLITVPMHTYMLYHNAINHLEGRKQKVFDLEFRLNETRNHLREFEDS